MPSSWSHSPPADLGLLLWMVFQCLPTHPGLQQLCQLVWQHHFPSFTIWFPWVFPKSNVFYLGQTSLTDRITSL